MDDKHAAVKIIADSVALELGIVPINERTTKKINDILSKLSPAEQIVCKRKFRKLWRKEAKKRGAKFVRSITHDKGRKQIHAYMYILDQAEKLIDSSKDVKPAAKPEVKVSKVEENKSTFPGKVKDIIGL